MRRALAGVDLAALARGVVAELAPQALDKQQAIELDAGPDCRVQGDGHAAGGAGAQPGRQRDSLQPARRARACRASAGQAARCA